MSERFVLIGVLLFVVVLLPVLLVRDYREKRKLKRIIESHRMKKELEANSKPYPGSEPDALSKQNDQTVPEGWGMNNSPFRNRKSGLSWGGGNIKASEAKRGTKRKFLRRP